MNTNAAHAFFRSAEGPRSISLCRSAAGMGLVVAVGLVFLLGPLGAHAHAAALTWDPAATGGAAGGSGVWDAASWWSGGSDGPWVSGTDAYFGGTAGTVSLVNPITANNVFFGTSGYLVTGNTLTLAGGTVNVATGANATIGSAVAGSGNSGLTLTGAARWS